MDEKQQGNPGHDLNLPGSVDLSKTDTAGATEPAPVGIEFVRPSAEYEASLVQEYGRAQREAMKMRFGTVWPSSVRSSTAGSLCVTTPIWSV